MSKSGSQKIIAEIKEKNIKPESKIKLNCKSYLFWFLLGVLVILGALFFSLVVLDVADMDFNLYQHFGLMKFMGLFFFTAPYLLIVLAIIMLTLGILSWRQTKRGYRHSIVVVAGIMLLIVVALGALGHCVRVNRPVEKGLAGPLRGSVQFEEKRWLQPEQGLLGGEVIVVVTERIDLRDFAGKDWQVYYSSETKMRPGFNPRPGERIGIVGEMETESEFEAYVIKLFPPKGQRPFWGPRGRRDE